MRQQEMRYALIRYDELFHILVALSKARPDLILGFQLVAEAVGIAAELREVLPPLITVEPLPMLADVRD